MLEGKMKVRTGLAASLVALSLMGGTAYGETLNPIQIENQKQGEVLPGSDTFVPTVGVPTDVSPDHVSDADYCAWAITVGLPCGEIGDALPPVFRQLDGRSLSPVVQVGPYCQGTVKAAFAGLYWIWGTMHVHCSVPVTLILRVEIVSSYVLPGGVGDRVVGSGIDAAANVTDWDVTGQADCHRALAGQRVVGFYKVTGTIWAITPNGLSNIAAGTTGVTALPCADRSVPTAI
jgi:hypothetical protein